MAEILIALLWIVGVIAWLGATFFAGCVVLDYGFKWIALPVAVFAVPLAVVIGISVRDGGSVEQGCLDSGRAWAVVGRHQEWQYSAATKTSHPVTVNTYGCVEWTR